MGEELNLAKSGVASFSKLSCDPLHSNVGWAMVSHKVQPPSWILCEHILCHPRLISMQKVTISGHLSTYL